MTLDEAENELTESRNAIAVRANAYSRGCFGAAYRNVSVFCEHGKNHAACRWAECKCECHAKSD